MDPMHVIPNPVSTSPPPLPSAQGPSSPHSLHHSSVTAPVPTSYPHQQPPMPTTVVPYDLGVIGDTPTQKYLAQTSIQRKTKLKLPQLSSTTTRMRARMSQLPQLGAASLNLGQNNGKHYSQDILVREERETEAPVIGGE